MRREERGRFAGDASDATCTMGVWRRSPQASFEAEGEGGRTEEGRREERAGSREEGARGREEGGGNQVFPIRHAGAKQL